MTENKRHIASIGMERFDDTLVMLLTLKGKLTHEDYQEITPLFDSAVEKFQGKGVRMLVDLEDFDGWEIRAAWDDFKLGVKYNAKFDRIALFGHKNWQDGAVKVMDWFISGETKSFHNYQSAIIWLTD
ncbi:STAS/SEC14 domain-containing protein [Vibrio salinus]|uniref:STAS/SEC14 domain-containing protein n=1 Tax=Vibrio salinus TaxID=2899784 RepID=UPI001E585122|nr:STAS/SEC14 domain-containing protein [Vibrio salinus]MCE0495642.1 STAS/SEC14 domain-containing protein [Vibrio salinus]